MQEANLKQKISDDVKQAMRSGDTVRRSTLRLLLSSIGNAEIAKRASLEDSDVLGIISKEVKQRFESIEAYKAGNRQDLVVIEEAELVILQEYLPEQMNREDVVAAVSKVIEETGAQGPADKGKVMQKIIPLLKGKADGRDINEVVTELLGK